MITASGARSPELRRLGKAGPNDGEMELLRAATLAPDAAAAAWHRWLSTHNIDDAHHRSLGVLPAVGANLAPEVLGNEAGRLKGLRRRAWADNRFKLLALIDASDVLHAAGIEAIVAKGAALSTTVYGAPGTRPMADIDLVVGPRNFEAACAALISAGWHQPHPTYPFFHVCELFDTRGRSVDVHRWVVFPRFSPVPETAWLERACAHEIFGHPVRRLTSPDELVLTALHGLMTNSPSATRWPLDIVQLARVAGARDADFWIDVERSAREVVAGPVVADALAMVRMELDAEVPIDVIDALRAAPIDRGLATHWAGCRRGVTFEWRIRRYARIERAEGRRPTVSGYVTPRIESFRRRGPADVARGRVVRVKDILSKRRRG